MTPIIDVKDVTRTFGSGPNATAALRGVTMTVDEGQLIALRGRSGSGKTTLLNIVGGLDAPDSGTVRIDGKDVTSVSDQQRVHLRRETVTYIFQSFSLLPGLSAAENVGVPLRIAGMAPKAREERVATMLTLVGLADEPTGQLDAETGKQIMRLLRAVVRSERVTALLATHDPTLMDIADSVLHLTDGAIRQES
jgi:putative ABC transport system ATP-binding protein